jgi:hypothetical protein
MENGKWKEGSDGKWKMDWHLSLARVPFVRRSDYSPTHLPALPPAKTGRARPYNPPALDALWPSRDALWPSLDALWPSLDGLWPSLDGLWPSRDGLCPSRDGLCPSLEAFCPSRDACCLALDACCLALDACCPSRDPRCLARDPRCPICCADLRPIFCAPPLPPRKPCRLPRGACRFPHGGPARVKRTCRRRRRAGWFSAAARAPPTAAKTMVRPRLHRYNAPRRRNAILRSQSG